MTNRRHHIADKLEVLEDFRIRNNLPQVKCLSDRILLYMRYGLQTYIKPRHQLYCKQHLNTEDNATSATEEEDYNKLDKDCIDFYEKYVRGQPEYTNKHPASIAAAIIYMCTVMSPRMIYITQKYISDIFSVNSVTLRERVKDLKDDFNKWLQEEEEE